MSAASAAAAPPLAASAALPADVIAASRAIIASASASDVDKEAAIVRASEALAKQNPDSTAVSDFLVELRPYFAGLSKTRTALIVHHVLEAVAKVPGTGALVIRLCRESIEWSKQEKRSVLRQKLETKLAGLLAENGELQAALDLIKPLLREVKKLDDKELLVEIFLIESMCHYRQHNLPKSKSSLTAARTNANQIYVQPSVQGRIDLLAGVLHTEENDHKTAFSYFLEAFENYQSLDSPYAELSLALMLLSKVMQNTPQDVAGILGSKGMLKYADRPLVEALRVISVAVKERSLKDFQAARQKFATVLTSDPLITSQLDMLADTMLEQNLLRLLEPFSNVEISHVAHKIGLPLEEVEKKLSQMILDRVLYGILDQGNGCLQIFEPSQADTTYSNALSTMKQLDQTVSSLVDKTVLLRN